MSDPASGEIISARPTADESTGPPSRGRIGLAGLVIVVAALAVYSNSFNGEFADDSILSILQNSTIQHGWGEALHPPAGSSSVSGRPLVNLSLALNYQLGGFNAWGYHAFNLGVEVLAGLTLFGLARRTLASPVLRGRYGAAALPLAFIVALIWTVHPLQTESVTYVIQRAESLMGLFYLLTLYCFVRGVESSRAWVWHAFSACACLAGMATKEVMATAPLMVLLYDRTFVAGTFAAAWRRRWKIHAALVSTWLLLAWVVIHVSWPGNASLSNPNLDGLNPLMKSYVYALKQCGAIAHYLWLSFWPRLLDFSYGNDVVTHPLEVAPQIVILALLVGATVYLLWRNPPLGFLGAWFFVILAPTSSVVPLNGQTMAEHRLYLSLAAPVVLVVLGLYVSMGWRAFAASLALALALGGLAFERNRDYRTNVSIWSDVVGKFPDNLQGHLRLGMALREAGRPQDALARFEAALRVIPGIPGGETNIGSILAHLGRFKEAIVHYKNEIQRNPDADDAYYNLGNAYYVTGQPELARDAYIEAVRINPGFALAHTNLASVYADGFGEFDQAMVEYEAAIQANPNLPEAHTGLGNLFLKTNRITDAIPHFSAAIRLNPNYGDAYLGLGNALFMTNQVSESISQYAAAVRLMPNSAGTHNNYGLALLQLNRFTEAANQFAETLRVDPRYPNAQDNLNTARQRAQPPPAIPPQ